MSLFVIFYVKFVFIAVFLYSANNAETLSSFFMLKKRG